MIDSRDLRIGNVLKCNTIFASFNQANNTLINSDLITVKAIDDTKIGYINTKYGLVFSQIEKFEPIKLTPEILEQVGFEKTKDFEDDDLYDFEASNYRKLTLVKLRGVDIFRVMDVDNSIDLKYLHELQNTFYIFNNKQELPIDINTLKI